MRQEKLSKLVDISIGRTPSRSKHAYWGEGHRWVSIRDLSSKIVTETKEQITDLALEEVKCKVVPKGTLLFSFKLTIGKMAFAGRDLFTNEAIAAFLIKDEKQLNYDYLYYALLSATFSGSNQVAMGKTLNSKSLAEIKIPLPSLDDQIRIAFLLGKVEALIAKRKQHLQQLDDLLKSVFLEMFGDPVRNNRGWDKPELKYFGEISTGNTPPRKDPTNYSPSLIEWVKTNNITDESIIVTESVEHLSKTGLIRARSVSRNALLVACIAGSIGSIGRAALTDRTVTFNQQINAIQPAADVNPLYIYVLFKLSRTYIQSHATKGMKKILTKGDFEQIKMIKPPIELQTQFSIIVSKIEDIKSRYKQSLIDLESLYGTLSQKAFKGELDLSRIKPPTQRIIVSDAEDQSLVSTTTTIKQLPTINLLGPNYTAEELYTKYGLKKLIIKWLETYRTQLANEAFSIERFMTAVQNRLTELYPDNEFEIGANEYEYIKEWIFLELDAGCLQQSRNSDSNMIELRAVPS